MNGHSDKARAKRRDAWPVGVRRLQDADPAAMPDSTAQQRIAAVAELTRQSWSLAGLEVPDYSRRATPIRLVPLSDSLPTTPAQ